MTNKEYQADMRHAKAREANLDKWSFAASPPPQKTKAQKSAKKAWTKSRKKGK